MSGKEDGVEYKKIELSVVGECATLFLNRPGRNLLTVPMMEEINHALMSLKEGSDLKVLVVRGRGGNFCEGIDMREHAQKRVQRVLQVFMRIFETMRMMNVITVAAVEGRAWGAGFELAIGCNLIVASETATFSLTQIKFGRIPPVASAILPRIAPRRHAMEWILTGNHISASRLEQDGVVSRLFPVDHFEPMLDSFVAEITDKSGPVLQLAKRAQFEAYYSTFPEALANIQSLYLKDLMSLEDAEEGPQAVREGRKPEWRNR